ncbi:MAG: hypothetical protein L0210_03505, partial [Rhodospirillales bacterium]|nr:hypothetical protein [Rhodospirillales bacterium]
MERDVSIKFYRYRRYVFLVAAGFASLCVLIGAAEAASCRGCLDPLSAGTATSNDFPDHSQSVHSGGPGQENQDADQGDADQSDSDQDGSDQGDSDLGGSDAGGSDAGGTDAGGSDPGGSDT